MYSKHIRQAINCLYSTECSVTNVCTKKTEDTISTEHLLNPLDIQQTRAFSLSLSPPKYPAENILSLRWIKNPKW